MKHASLFSGIGGFELAAHWSGWETVFTSELNPYLRRILKYYWPEAEHYGDIRQHYFDRHKGKVDILTGGFPCQPFSVAGARRGTQDDRYLWGEMLRVIQEASPRWVVAENVRGFVSQEKGVVFDQVQADLEAEGYQILPALLPACAVGAPHRRDRIWIIAYSGQTPQAGGSEEARWGEGESFDSGPSRIRAVTYPGGERLEGRSHEEGQEEAERHDCVRYPRDGGYTWEDFPSESPIYRTDDGVPPGVDDLSPTEWYRLTLTAYGNAIVPQVAFQIFQAINQYEILNQ